MTYRAFQVTFYLGGSTDAHKLYETMEVLAKRPRFGSMNKLIRHCVDFTLKNDKSLERRSRKSLTVAA